MEGNRHQNQFTTIINSLGGLRIRVAQRFYQSPRRQEGALVPSGGTLTCGAGGWRAARVSWSWSRRRRRRVGRARSVVRAWWRGAARRGRVSARSERDWLLAGGAARCRDAARAAEAASRPPRPAQVHPRRLSLRAAAALAPARCTSDRLAYPRVLYAEYREGKYFEIWKLVP